jgi:hypothetical protein
MRGWGNVYLVLLGKPEGKMPLGKPRCKWVEGAGGNATLRRLAGLTWIGFTWLRRARALLNSVMNHPVVEPQNYLFNYKLLDLNLT